MRLATRCSPSARPAAEREISGFVVNLPEHVGKRSLVGAAFASGSMVVQETLEDALANSSSALDCVSDNGAVKRIVPETPAGMRPAILRLRKPAIGLRMTARVECPARRCPADRAKRSDHGFPSIRRSPCCSPCAPARRLRTARWRTAADFVLPRSQQDDDIAVSDRPKLRGTVERLIEDAHVLNPACPSFRERAVR